MAVCPTPIFSKEERPFVDRKEFIEAFEAAFKNIGKKDYSVLVYYGIGGIGKTSLRKELPKLLKEYNESYQNTDIIWASVDFSIESHRQMDKFLGILKNELNQKCGVKFHLFDIAHATYWRKVNPQIPLSREGYSEDSIVTDLLDSFGGLVSINYSSIRRVVERAPDRFKEWSLKRETEIARLPDMEALDIEKKLPVFFAHDLTDYLQKTSKSAVIFIDSYEALWEKKRGQGSFNSRDEWIRQLIANLPKSSLWVICGREELRWKEADKDWNKYLEQKELKELPEKDAFDFLTRCGIKEEDIQKVIIEGSEGVPYYLELAVDTYTEIVKTSSPKPDDFAKTRSEIFDRFMKYLGVPEKETLKVLSTPRFWNQDIFKALINNFNTGYPLTAFLELNRFSFVQETEGKLQLHPLMKESLQVYQDQDLKKEVHNFMLDLYSNRIKQLDIKSVTPVHETALIEAFYHAKEVLEAEKLFNWFTYVSDPFYKAAFWQFISPMYEEMQQVLEANLGSEHIDVATSQDALSKLYRHTGEYEKALPLCRRALETREKVLGPEHPDVATTLNTLAALHEKKGEHDHALPLYKRTLEIREKVLGPGHPDVANAQNNLAELYRLMGEYEKALPLHKRALEIREKVLGSEHPDVANTLNNLALLYENIGKYDKALLLYNQALEIIEKVCGPVHPYIATTLNNLVELYCQIGEHDKALPLCKRALEINEKVLGLEHPHVGITLGTMAQLYICTGKNVEALPLLDKAVKIFNKSLGSEHVHTATALGDLAVLYERMGDYKKAISNHKQSLEIKKKALGPEHPDVAMSMVNIADFYGKNGRYDEAIQLFEQALNILEKKLGPEHPCCVQITDRLISIYGKM